ncbi:MAG: CPBP family intramembrane metalloprotease [Planctomycetota bacterium]|nr:CPBP family intramembrane metalloprotease [Planctomycetota bacterium]
MTPWIQEWLIASAMVAVGLIALALLVRAGFLRAGAFAGAPERRVGLNGLDLAVGLVVLVLGSTLAQQIISAPREDPPPAATQPAAQASSQPATEPATQPATSPSTQRAGPQESSMHLALTQIAVQLLGEGGVLVFLACRVMGKPQGLREIGLVPRRPLRDIGTGLLATLAAAPLVFDVIAVTALVGDALGHPQPTTAHKMLEAMLNSESRLALALMMVSAVAIAPVVEEAIFRGLVQTVLLEALGRDRRWTTIVVSSVIFTSVHVGSAAWQAMPGLFVLGLILGWLYERSGSLLPSILLHVGFNAVNTAMLLQLSPAGTGGAGSSGG